jgi:hypothetical protein
MCACINARECVNVHVVRACVCLYVCVCGVCQCDVLEVVWQHFNHARRHLNVNVECVNVVSEKATRTKQQQFT